TEDLLVRYAWYTNNSLNKSLLPVGSLKPNDLGLFDMLGNSVEWCQEAIYFYRPGSNGQASEDVEDINVLIRERSNRVLHGGSFIARAGSVRSAFRYRGFPGFRNGDVGFRPARTIR